MSEYDPLADFDQRMARRRAEGAAERRQAPRVEREGSSRIGEAFEVVDSFVYFVADTVTVGYMDEVGSWLDHTVLGQGESVGDRLREYREGVDRMREEHPYAALIGSLVGALVPFGALTRANSVRQMVLGGGAMGALYGSGSSDAEDLMGRLEGAVTGGLIGAGTGYALGGVLIPAAKWGGGHIAAIFRNGRAPRLEGLEFAPAATRAPDVPSAPRPSTLDAPTPTRINTITGAAEDQIEEGALLSLRELLGDPGAARKALQQRLGRMTSEEAQRIANRLEQAELSGEVVSDPHFRSLLGLDISDTEIDTDTAFRAIALLEEAAEAIFEKAGNGRVSFQQQTREFSERLEEGVIMEDLSEALKNASKGYIDGRIATNAQMLAGITLVRAKQQLLPEIKRGVEGAKEQLAETLTKAAHMLAMANGIKSAFGRNLGSLRNAGKFGLDDGIADDLIEVESLEAIRKRVDGALKDLGDDDLVDLLGRIRTLDDVHKIENILTNAEEAQAFGAWRRTMNTVSTFLKSNALTPATGLFNTISFVGHDFFRNHLAKGRAARNLARAGRMDEATALRFELEVGRSVYWAAQRRGLKALFNRVRWEAWGDVERIAAVGWGRGSAASFARGRRQSMLERGYQAPDLREFQQQPRLAVTDTVGFNRRLGELKAGGGAFGNIVYHLQRAGAVAGNTLDAAGQASMKLFTGAVDDWGRAFITMKETYALSARQAIREAMEQGLPQDKMLDYAKRRAVELAEMPPADILAKAEARLAKGLDPDEETLFYARMEKEVDLEADRTLFMDGPQTSGGRASMVVARGADKLVGLGQVEGILLPYIRTPIRLFERGLVSYTPWGKASREVQQALARGGAQAEIVKAQMELGFMGMKLGMLLGTTGVLRLTNGGWQNSGNLEAGPPNRIELPGGVYFEIGRLDPFALTLALGGFLGQALNAGFRDGTEYEAEEGFRTALQIAWLSIRDAVLEKSYLNGLQDLLEVLFAREDGAAMAGVERAALSAFTRIIPASGISRQINDTIRGTAPETVGWMDNMLRAIPGAGLYLDPRVDALGNEVESRVMGLAFGNSETNDSEPITDVTRQLRELGINLRNLRRADPAGFELTSSELTALRRIRATEALNRNGQTMQEALAELLADPYFLALPNEDQKQDEVVRVMAEFNEPAREILEERDPQYLANRAAFKSLTDYMAEGMSRRDAEAQARDDNQRFGLLSPDR